ncbi:MAG: hypothetical protein JNJ80_24430, partial [Gemmatimonadetes bacterium]|nr:hypothetical protein [Gemmatimonadota bacterium]
MKQTLVLALFAFLVATATTTWFITKVSPPRAAIAKDSLADSTAAPPPATATAATAPDSAADSTAAKPAPAPPAAAPAKVEAPVDPAEAARAKSVAKIIASMKAKDAVEILAKLTDDEVE